MSEARRLLAEATPLPWKANAIGTGLHSADHPDWPSVAYNIYSSHNRALIVYAVNRLPDYEAAVEALERISDALILRHQKPEWLSEALNAMRDGDAALARLREPVPG